MKLFNAIALLAAISLLTCACVSRTTTTNAPLGQGEDGKVTEKKLIWIWQKEYRNP